MRRGGNEVERIEGALFIFGVWQSGEFGLLGRGQFRFLLAFRSRWSGWLEDKLISRQVEGASGPRLLFVLVFFFFFPFAQLPFAPRASTPLCFLLVSTLL